MTNIPFQSVNFNEYYQNVHGEEIEIDFTNRCLLIFTSDKQIVSTIQFSKSISHHFTFEDLLKSQHKVGEKTYAVYPDGFENFNWLWVGDVLETL